MIKQSAIATAVAITVGTASLHAGPMTSATFTMYDPTGALNNIDTAVISLPRVYLPAIFSPKVE